MTYLTEKRFRTILDEELDRKLDFRFAKFEKTLDQKLDKKIDEKFDQKFDEKLAPYATREETELMMGQKFQTFGQDLLNVFVTKDEFRGFRNEVMTTFDIVIQKLDILLKENVANTSAHERMWNSINTNTKDIKLLKQNTGL